MFSNRRPQHRLRRFLLPAVLALALAGCAASEPLPALVAKADTGRYGYSENQLAEDRLEVVYESPSFSVPISSESRRARLEEERQRAYDFALWRAADIAKERGFSAFSVEHDRRDVDVSLQAEPVYRPLPGFYPYYYGYPYRYGYRPWGMYDPWDGYGGYRRWAYARVTVSLDVQLLKTPTPESLPVEETLARLASTYGRPTYD